MSLYSVISNIESLIRVSNQPSHLNKQNCMLKAECQTTQKNWIAVNFSVYGLVHEKVVSIETLDWFKVLLAPQWSLLWHLMQQECVHQLVLLSTACSAWKCQLSWRLNV